VSSDEAIDSQIAELIREAALAGVRDELPHSIAVTVEEMHPRAGREDLIEIFATLHLERSSQKPILLGTAVVACAMSASLPGAASKPPAGSASTWTLHVAVMGEWQRDPKKLDRLGF